MYIILVFGKCLKCLLFNTFTKYQGIGRLEQDVEAMLFCFRTVFVNFFLDENQMITK